MPSGGKNYVTHAPGRGELDGMRVEYSEPLAAWIFPRQGTHGSYAVHRVDGCARTRVVYFSKKYRGRWKKQSHDIRRITNSTTSGVHNDQHRAARTHRTARFTEARNPAACTYFTAFHRIRFTHNAVVSKAYVKSTG